MHAYFWLKLTALKRYRVDFLRLNEAIEKSKKLGRSHMTRYHVPEVRAEGAAGLVVLHHTVVVEDLATAVTDGEQNTEL